MLIASFVYISISDIFLKDKVLGNLEEKLIDLNEFKELLESENIICDKIKKTIKELEFHNSSVDEDKQIDLLLLHI